MNRKQRRQAGHRNPPILNYQNNVYREALRRNKLSSTGLLKFQAALKEYKKSRSQRERLKGPHSESIIKDLRKKAGL